MRGVWILDFKWTGSFADARNFAFSKAAMEYIYSADADEVLDQPNYEKFMTLKKALLPEVEIVQMKYGNQLAFGTVYNFDEEYRPKLFKRLRTFRWTEAIHETVNLEPVIYGGGTFFPGRRGRSRPDGRRDHGGLLCGGGRSEDSKRCRNLLYICFKSGGDERLLRDMQGTWQVLSGSRRF